MKRIGLTGGIASGKSTASAILRGWGACIIDADASRMGLWSRGDRFTRRIARILAQASFCRTASSTVGASADCLCRLC